MNTKYSWSESDNIICSLCYLQNFSYEKTKIILNHIPLNSIKMKYKNCLFLDKGNIKGSLPHCSEMHKKIWEKLKI